MQQPIKVPPLGESVTEATVSKWLKKVGEAVKADETLLELETDKVTLEVNAPASGVLTSISAADGVTVAVGDLLGEIDSAAAPTVTSAPAATAAPTPTPAPMSAPPLPSSVPATIASSASDKLSPAVRKLGEEKGLDPTTLQGSGKDGRLLKADVLGAPAPSLSTGIALELPLNGNGNGNGSEAPQEERVKLSRLRQRIAERLKEAQNTAAMLTTFNEIDMTNVMATRKRYQDSFEKKYGVRLGFMSFFTKACVTALKEIPAINAQIDGDEIVYKNYYDISVAVSSPQGLVVPVVRAADKLNFADVEKTIGALGKKAREGKLSMQDLSGGTFTITNGGIFGSLMSTPILNTPQSGILGMHKIQERPMVVDGKIEVRPMMYVALSYDHRLVDGREAVTFLVRVKECIEDPERLLLEI
ncbi:MAG: 2-oxoglutarate dehydrogenase complex dihydrolipoyllysine-residue succinyltransferase [Alphaproteobacteria bacterium]|nr:2-oxoglutarate dehydrogenase complex dihydrolipoyllysine-residue succinyltransferase [Alphaproteobacteria bacterium]